MVKEQLPTEKTVLRGRREALLHRNSNKYRIMAAVLDWMPQGLKLGYYGGRWVDDVRREIVSFLEAMQWEYHRRTNQAVLSEEEILHSYWEGFGHAQNITLIALRAKIRIPSKCPPIDQLLTMPPGELPLILPIILGKAYSINDLEADLASGICNIPKSTLEMSGLTLPNLMENPSQAVNNQVINDWAANEVDISKQLATKLRQKKLDLPTKAMVEFLTAGIAGSRI